MVSSIFIRFCGFAAMACGLLSFVLAPLATFAGFRAWGNYNSPTMGWAQMIEPLVLPLLTFGTRQEVYAAYGKGFFPAFLLFILGLLGLKAHLGEPLEQQGEHGFRIMLTGLVMNLLGNIGDYWLGKDILGQYLWGASFVVGTLLGFIVYIVGSVMLGLAIFKASGTSSWLAWPLLLTTPVVILLTVIVVHLPSAPTLSLGLTWLILGFALIACNRSGLQA